MGLVDVCFLTRTKKICADCITKFVHSVVSDAYASAEGMALPEGMICVHGMCALTSSWWAFSHSFSNEDLMAARLWCLLVSSPHFICGTLVPIHLICVCFGLSLWLKQMSTL